jgi:hypothetical protein
MVDFPGLLKSSFDDLLGHLRFGDRPLISRIFRAAAKQIWYRSELCVYVLPVEEIGTLPHPVAMQRDRFDDLRYYERTAAVQLSPENYRREARARLDRGEHLYTLVENDTLLHYAWLVPFARPERDKVLGQVFYPAADSVSLYDHFTHPFGRRRGLYFKAMCQILHDVPLLTSAKQVYIYVYADNDPSRRVIEKVGFHYLGSMVMECRLRMLRRYPLSVSGEFRTALL